MHFARFIVLGHHSIPKINWGSFRDRREKKWGSFRGRYHFWVGLGIFSGLGIISGSGSFRGLYRSHTADSNLIVLAPIFMEGMGSVLRNFEESWITLVSAVLQSRKFLK